MNTLSYDILEAIQTKWTATTASATLVPGGLWYARVPQDTAIPYGIITVEDGKKTFTTNGYFLQNFVFQVAIYSAGGPGSTNAKAIATLISSVFDFMDKSTTLTTGRLICFQPGSNTVELDPGLRNAEDVLITKASFDVVGSGGNTL